MRVTTQSTYRNTLINLEKITADMSRINGQISSGKQMSTIADDPVNLVSTLGLHTNIAQIAQYQKNLQFGNTMITAAESALNSMKDLAIRGKELAIQMANGTMTQANRASAAEEVRHLWEQAIFLANSEVGGKYVFGGYRTAGYTAAEPAPFVADKASGYIVQGQPLTPLAATDPVQYNLAAPPSDLTINGIAIGATVSDGLSSAHDTASAAAKVTAINALTAQTGVTADYTAASVTAAGAVDITAGTNLGSGPPADLIINGKTIVVSGISVGDANNALLNAINAQSATTGVIASRDASGTLTLTASDGRNIEINTSGKGGAITQFNGAAAGDNVYFGTVQLKSDRSFTLQATPAGFLATLGLTAATAPSSGTLSVTTIQQQTGNVRYAGDPTNNISVKVGPTSDLEIAKNGMDAVMKTGVFSSLKGLENALRAQKYTTVTGTQAATDTTALLASGTTGLTSQNGLNFVNGTLSFTVTDQSSYPPQSKTINLAVDPTTDTPQTIADRISQIQGLKASWSSDGHLTVESSNPDRFTFSFTDSSNFMAMNGITQDTMQFQAIENSIGDLGTLLDNLNNQVSDFGARANRIDTQSSLYTNLNLASQENLSQKEDTDLVKAATDLQNTQTAYQAALAAAAKTMQLSLVDYLK